MEAGIIADIVVVIIILINLIIGFKKGFLRCLLGMGTTLASVIACILLAKPTATGLDKLFDLSATLQDWTGGFLGGSTGWYLLLLFSALGIFIVLRLILILVDHIVKNMKEKMPSVNFFDQSLGLFFGLAMSAVYFIGLAMTIQFVAEIPFMNDLTKWLQLEPNSGSFIAQPIYEFIKDHVTPKIMELMGWAAASAWEHVTA